MKKRLQNMFQSVIWTNGLDGYVNKVDELWQKHRTQTEKYYCKEEDLATHRLPLYSRFIVESTCAQVFHLKKSRKKSKRGLVRNTKLRN